VKLGFEYLATVTDEDGWYMIGYKHKGKPTDRVILGYTG
jgi:hypothetical protein